VNERFSKEEGQGLVELLVALTVLAIGIGSLLTLLTSSALSLQRSDQKGTALVLAEKQLELYRGFAFRDIRLDQNSLDNITAPGVDPTNIYGNANSVDPKHDIPVASNQLTDTAPGNVTDNCPDPPNVPPECAPVQPKVPGPDHRWYRIDTYIHEKSDQGGDPYDEVFVVVRDYTKPATILARSSSTFSSIGISNINGKAIVKLSFSAPTADLTGTPIANTQISATLSNGVNENGTLNFFVLPAPATPAAPCGSAGWTQLGSVTVNGNRVYNPPGGYTPPSAGTYYWYASYSGDPGNKKTSAVCGASSPRMVVQATKWSPSLSVSTTASTGYTNTAVPASSITAAVSASSGTTTAPITYMVYGPSATAPATCTTTAGGLWSQVGTLTPNGNGLYSPNTGWTPTAIGTYWYYARYPGDLTNNGANSLCNSSSMAQTVVTVPPDKFGFSAIGASQTAGTPFTIGTITAQLYSGGTDTSYSGVKTLVFSGPGASAKGNVPTYPASVTFTNGVATNVSITLFKAETTTLTATQGAITGSSGSFTVGGLSAVGFSLDPPGAQQVNNAFPVTIRTVDTYGNPATYTPGSHSIMWTGASNAPDGTPPNFPPGTAQTVTFNNIGGQGVAIATGIVLYKATTTALTAKEGSLTGTSGSFVVSGASPASMVFINCTQPTSANTTCAGSPLATGNNGTLQANVALKDNYGNITAATGPVSITLTSNNPGEYSVTPTPVSIGSGGSQTNQFTVSPVHSNPATSTITAHVASGGSWSDISIDVKKQ
jgi:type II secretory pathway pseudopilin PulG